MSDAAAPSSVASEVGPIEFSAAEIAKAESAVAKIVQKHDGLVVVQVDRLAALWQESRDNFTPEARKACSQIVHDLSGYGTTLGYQLVTVLGRSLRRVMGLGELTQEVSRELINAHVAALRAVCRQNIKGDGGPIGRALLDELDRAIEKSLKRRNPAA
jgi:hypothetical protein